MGCSSSSSKAVDKDGLVRFTDVVTVSPLKALVHARERWSLEDLDLQITVGEGMFSRVRIAKIKEDSEQRPIALKILRKMDIVKLKQVDHVKAEKEILLMITHPFIVDLLGSFQDEGHLYMMMEYVNGGELHEHVQNQGGAMPSDEARFYSSEIFLALAYLHSLRVAHRDLKPQNLLISAEGHIKLTDFGFAKVIKDEDKTYTLVGTPEYVAPEIVREEGHALAVDWWAFGVVLFEMLCGYTPFCAEDMDAIFENVKAGGVDFPKSMDAKAQKLIGKLLVEPVAKRLGSMRGGVGDIMKDPWFKGVDFGAVLRRTVPPSFIPPVKSSDDTSMFVRYNPRETQEGDVISAEEQAMFRRFSARQPEGMTADFLKKRLYPDAAPPAANNAEEVVDISFTH